MIDIDVVVVYGDYEIHYQEEEYHDNRIGNFKFQLEDIITKHKINFINRCVVHCEYYPDRRKFKIIDYSHNYKISIHNALEYNPAFKKEYLL